MGAPWPSSDFASRHGVEPTARVNVLDDRPRDEANPLRETADLLSRINVIWVVQSFCEKYSAFPVGQIISTSSPRPASQRGDSRSSRSAGRDAVDAGAPLTNALKRTAKSCGPDAPTLALTRDNALHCAGMVTTKPGSPRRSRRKPLKPLRGECRAFRCDRGDYTRMLILFCMRGCGCIERPAFPAPSDWRAGAFW
jgi:hypothetical protein